MVRKYKTYRSTFQIDIEMMSAAKEALRLSHIVSKVNVSPNSVKGRVEDLIGFGMITHIVERDGRSLKKAPINKFQITEKGLQALEIVESARASVLNSTPMLLQQNHRK